MHNLISSIMKVVDHILRVEKRWGSPDAYIQLHAACVRIA
jgi:hypothetical protein